MTIKFRNGRTQGWLLAISCLPGLLGFPGSGHATEPQGRPLVLAVHPYLTPNEISERFRPLADYLANALGRPVNVRVGRDYDEHVDFIGQDRVDIAFLGPASYVKLQQKYGAKPLLATIAVNGKPLFRGYFVVRRDSGLRTLTDLKGKRVAFVDQTSTMGFIVPQYMLLQAGVRLDRLATHQFLNNHDNVALAVLAGDYDAGAVKSETFDRYQPRGLRVLATTPEIPEHLFVASAGLPETLVARLRRLFLGLNKAPSGRAIMQSINPQMTALAPASPEAYRRLRDIMEKVEQQPR
jgi:phosphonate transport system substrate-binding protein